ncbi:hypothetical protein M2475_001889 [Breznakia sp. PF5-3]|uniref:hypothetical protein n=1 Tax=unclassified Breznakia TaxID=2623764 RepID=UPI002405865A|nr:MULTISPECIES: hypothetical protein [unclassified Breznakia]MDF9825433.1 hypothetical protein [Breznakia sp. PM6-1]MDF9836311.1 hypothetical protein [Breznakia sp. PF5-3]MDF9838542.1 hypothetical protein [Breznakia sp. PFB2-8]MDF9860574.1 hypothetical protein [Breznakia sp. PH5-24]
MKSIYILLTKSNTYVSKTIQLATADKYTHISISFHESLQPMYSFARKYIHLPLPAGLRVEPLSQGYFKENDFIPCALYKLDVEDEVYEKAQLMVLQMMDHADIYKFNVIGLLLCKLNIPLKRQHHYFCSEFVSEVLIQSEAISLTKDPSLIRPSDYLNFQELNYIYSGEIRDLVETVKLNYVNV